MGPVLINFLKIDEAKVGDGSNGAAVSVSNRQAWMSRATALRPPPPGSQELGLQAIASRPPTSDVLEFYLSVHQANMRFFSLR